MSLSLSQWFSVSLFLLTPSLFSSSSFSSTVLFFFSLENLVPVLHLGTSHDVRVRRCRKEWMIWLEDEAKLLCKAVCFIPALRVCSVIYRTDIPAEQTESLRVISVSCVTESKLGLDVCHTKLWMELLVLQRHGIRDRMKRLRHL